MSQTGKEERPGGTEKDARALDYPAPSPQGVTPWRRATLIASAIAAVELAVIVVAGVAVFGKTVAKHVEKAAVARVYAPVKTTATPLDAPAGAARLPRSQTVVTVLNGSRVSGAARGKADALRAFGYVVGQVGNAPHPALHTVVEYLPGYRAEAARLARDLRLKRIAPLDGLRKSDLLGAQVALILGT
jgi:LytR cell envelope-related transcriptional attenuator